MIRFTARGAGLRWSLNTSVQTIAKHFFTPEDYTVERTYDVCDSCYKELLKWLHEEE